LTCPECETAKQNPNSGLYQFNCRDCRERLISKERCKEARKELIARFRTYGINEVQDGGCKCKIFCYRQRMVDGRS
jgi:hypothetical protein